MAQNYYYRKTPAKHILVAWSIREQICNTTDFRKPGLDPTGRIT